MILRIRLKKEFQTKNSSMNFIDTGVFEKQKVRIKNLLPEIGIEKARAEIIAGLTSKNKSISSKYFYDEIGSDLFEAITELPEYYPTRTEKSILESIAPELMNRNSSFEIIELGSGDCSKISILIEAVQKVNLENVNYIPIDISKSAIENSTAELLEKFPDMKINGYVADFIHQLNQIPHSEKPRLICFLGSTIGNFSKSDSTKILRNLAKGLLKGDSLLVGFDLVKPKSVLHAAYNDSAGVTEQFNKNILNVVNSIIDTDFNTDDFNHHSFFNHEKSRIEMNLVANKNCSVNSPFIKSPIYFENGESIHTENSHKYYLNGIEELIANSGLVVKNSYTDPKKWFALVEFANKS